jgi:SAM-dependent methyltransferase
MDDRRLSFGSAAASYDANRPRYPVDAVRWVFDVATRPVHDVADVGAGTGALTGVLVELEYDVTAFDADPLMLEQLAKSVPTARIVTAPAESLPVGEQSFDALTVGQAFHWFEPSAAAAEFHRVLRPGGVTGLFWNMRDDRAAWWGALRPIIDGPDWQRSDGSEALRELSQHFNGVEREEFEQTISMSPERIVNLCATFSYVRLREDSEQVLDRVREVLATHPDTKGRAIIDVPYVTAAYRIPRP